MTQSTPPKPVETESQARYEVHGEIARGGMGVVLLGRRRGPFGFSRAVAIKRLHRQFADDAEFVRMFCDEARLAAGISHANVVATLDVEWSGTELQLVMEYVHGEPLSRLVASVLAQSSEIPVKLAATLLSGVLHGLHAAHETRSERGEALHIVHRDVSPDNILVGADGVPRVLDFGVARAQGCLRATPSGEIKGKLLYMAPEQLRGESVDARVDVYSAAVVLWEVLTGKRLFDGPSQGSVVSNVLTGKVLPPSEHNGDVPNSLDAIVLKGLARDPQARFQTAREMALSLEREVGFVSQSEVSAWVLSVAGPELEQRAARLERLQQPSGPAPDDDADMAEQGTRRLPAPPRPVPAPSGVATTPHGRLPSKLRLASYVGVLAGVLLLAIWSLRIFARTPPTPGSQIGVTPPHDATPPAPAPPVSPRRLEGEGPPVPAASEPMLAPAIPVKTPMRRKHVRRRRTEKQARELDCSPPYEVDALGVKHPKVSCL